MSATEHDTVDLVKELKALRKQWRTEATRQNNMRVTRGGDREYDARCYGMQIAFEQCANQLTTLLGSIK